MKYFLLFAFLLFTPLIFAQKVANYSFGEPGTPEYEEFSFWIKDSVRTEITYTYGENWKEVKVFYSGKYTFNSENCFKVKFTNKYELIVIPQGMELKVVDLKGQYDKLFKWHYEGPVDGLGTFCEPCAQDEKEAMQLIIKYFI